MIKGVSRPVPPELMLGKFTDARSGVSGFETADGSIGDCSGSPIP